jgi:two-component system chemotaxis sensor kinase CheA
MDELLREFLTETAESPDHVDPQLVRFEREPNNGQVLSNVFRLVHTIKGTCGFLGLPRLEALTHAAETLMGKFRDGLAVTGEAVSLMLAAIDRIKTILDGLEKLQREPPGDDTDLIRQLNRAAARAQETNPRLQGDGSAASERAADQTALEDGDTAVFRNLAESGDEAGSVASQSIRVSIDTLDQLMTMVSDRRCQVISWQRNEANKSPAASRRLGLSRTLAAGSSTGASAKLKNRWFSRPSVFFGRPQNG